jgi:heme A synthase
MVKSGLSEELNSIAQAVPRVSHYRLTAHLGSAFLLYGGMLLTGWQILSDTNKSRRSVRLRVCKGHGLYKMLITNNTCVRRSPIPRSRSFADPLWRQQFWYL